MFGCMQQFVTRNVHSISQLSANDMPVLASVKCSKPQQATNEMTGQVAVVATVVINRFPSTNQRSEDTE